MQKELFRLWLRERRTERSAGDCISRCKKVENTLDIDLDVEYERDRGKSVLTALGYGRKQVDKGEVFNQSFIFRKDCNYVQRFTDLRCSVKQYFAFCDAQMQQTERDS